MQALQNMDPDKMIIILPSALVAMYLIISVQNFLCQRRSPYIGLILPAVSFIISTILAVRPLLVQDTGESGGLMLFCLRMWVTFNLATLVFLFPYYRHRKLRAAAKAPEPDAVSLQEQQPEDKLQSEKTNA